MIQYLIIFLMFIVSPIFGQNTASSSEAKVVKENQKAFLASDLDRYVVYDLLSDGTKIYKDTLDFNKYRDKALFAITQNQTIINYQLWATIILLIVTIGLLVFIIVKKV